MQLAASAKPQNKYKESADKAGTASHQTPDVKAVTRNGMPLFLQRTALSDFAPSLIQRQPIEEEEEMLQRQAAPGTGQRAPIGEEEQEEEKLLTMPNPDSIQRQAEEGEEEEEEETQPQIQAKLTVSQPNDEYEKEADHVAGTVMRMTDSAIHRKPT